MEKYKLRLLKNGTHFGFAVTCEELFNAINRNCHILAIGSETDEAHHVKICREVRFYGGLMSLDEIAAFIENNPDMFARDIAFCKGIVLEDDGQETLNFKNKIEIKKKTNGTKDPPN